MNLDRIQNTLQVLFQARSRWLHPGQRIVFWYDSDNQPTLVRGALLRTII